MEEEIDYKDFLKDALAVPSGCPLDSSVILGDAITPIHRSPYLDVGHGDSVAAVAGAVSSRWVASLETNMQTTIGILCYTSTENRLVSVAEFCAYLDLGESSHMDEEYFDDTLITELVKFNYDPYTGIAIDWARVEKLVMERDRIF